MVYLVDASVYIFRAWYAQRPDQRDGDGNPTHALYGFARFLGDLIERVFRGSREQLFVRLFRNKKLTAQERALLSEILEEEAP